MKARILSSRGQIVIPAAFFFPTLFLFVFLLFETAKLSREKIRHQFAADAAVFVEMTNYSDFLNRSAYVNGAFPMRIFYEGFHGTPMDCVNGTSDKCPGNTTLDELLYHNGAFPRSQHEPNPDSFMNEAGNDAQWDIAYGPSSANSNDYSPGRDNINNPDADIDQTKCRGENGSIYPETPCFTILTSHDANFYNLNWDDSNQVYRLYVQIYQLLGSVESAQYQVLQRLTTGSGKKHNFLQKSYWLNVGGDDAVGEAMQGAAQFSGGNDAGFEPGGGGVKFHCIQYMHFWGNLVDVHNLMQHTFVSGPPDPLKMPDNIPNDCQGLFQVVTVKQSYLDSMSYYGSGQKGWDATFDWHPPANNYFNIPLSELVHTGSGLPQVHATAFVGGFGGAVPGVWPNPTPKFQVRSNP